ncbi:MAG: alpha/beta fold hydrolase [Albidovulum sp.]|uniref:thioesterase II family protein n=1 Tax=Albidovulum sp. TaxID=1872424 RepID=UPI003C92FE44
MNRIVPQRPTASAAAPRPDTGFYRYPGRATADLRLFCFPFAGGSAQDFEPLATHLPPWIEVVGVDYPGRRSRFGEDPLSRLDLLVHDLAVGIRAQLDRPFAFYGHSNGALVAFELARRLPKMYFRSPEKLILGAKRSPTLGAEEPMHLLPKEAFIERLRDYQGTPEQVLANTELMDLFLPILRADFALSETYQLTDPTPVGVPIHAIAGRQDHLATPAMMSAWKSLANKGFELTELDAEHFFLSSVPGQLAQSIAATLSPATITPPTSLLSKERIMQC